MGITNVEIVCRVCNMSNFDIAWRIEIAKRLLLVPKNTLTDAAEGAGYASDSAFARVFKKETGMTPAGFRKSTIAAHSDV
ncbi:helix-turn-helix domain-containing protein [Hoeflea prorocentri]|uniref:AraC family transcriptional regulator n=1 Tax=Hoeflea prorocentri TaxID=1922333 RepID=A0A9X3ZIU3_9HYPH|nr:AraC family transcriptional regulator [Hoeflea prorocentri]MCY6382095.1 AraC family transcriptional regulator [Hoeflea prorocentri]MDA5399895.1 AraC family transcriptional regulator [Hoeflea prorocentri]